MSSRVESVEITRLFVEDQKSRTKVTPEVKELAESILSAAGQINPITVRKVGNEFRVIAGRRRYAALTYIQEELRPEETIKAKVYVVDISELEEELIKIDENIMREDLSGYEFDEAMFRRKQIYEELHPETRKAAAGGNAAQAKRTGKKAPVPFSKNAATRLHVSKKTVERSVARASKASTKVKKAHEKGELSPSKVDLLVKLSAPDQDLLLTVCKTRELSEIRPLVEAAQKRGARAVMLDLEDSREEDKRLKPLIRAAASLSAAVQDALESKLVFEGDSKHDSLRAMDELAQRIAKFTSFQRSALGYVKAISRKDGVKKVIRGRE